MKKECGVCRFWRPIQNDPGFGRCKQMKVSSPNYVDPKSTKSRHVWLVETEWEDRCSRFEPRRSGARSTIK